MTDDLDAIAALPTPKRPPLGLATIVDVCGRATRSALDIARTKPEDALRHFTRAVSGLLPADPATTSLDGWIRLGAEQGALDGWTGSQYRMPPDAPSPEHSYAHGCAWSIACGVVMFARGGRRG